MPRFEDSLDIRCCGAQAEYQGNMSLREAGAPRTEIYYRCVRCLKAIYVADGSGYEPDLAGIDTTP